MRLLHLTGFVAVTFYVCLVGPIFAQKLLRGEQRSALYNPADGSASILRYENVNNGDGNYRFAYETSNGILAEEQGTLQNAGTDNAIQTAKGRYQYQGPESQLFEVTYTADTNGFRASGAHLPKPHPIPPEIQKSLDIIYSNVRSQQTAAGQPVPSHFNRPQGIFRPPRN